MKEISEFIRKTGIFVLIVTWFDVEVDDEEDKVEAGIIYRLN
jgi:hypothetical protein